MSTTSLGRSNYCFLFIDHYSRYTVVYTIGHKSEVVAYFRRYKAEVENKHKHRIQRLRSDAGGEYMSKEFTRVLEDAGIIWEQQQNIALNKTESRKEQTEPLFDEQRQCYLQQV